MRNHILFSLLLLAACSKSEAERGPRSMADIPKLPAGEAAAPKQLPPAPPAKPKPTPIQDTLSALAPIAAKSTAELQLDLDRKFVFVTIDPRNDKKTTKAFCGDDDMKAWNALPDQIIARYAGRIASADFDQIRCTKHGELSYCELAPQDEHEKELTFAIVDEPGRAVLAGIVERETWMVDPDSARYQKDERERDAILAKATKQACAEVVARRGLEQDR